MISRQGIVVPRAPGLHAAHKLRRFQRPLRPRRHLSRVASGTSSRPQLLLRSTTTTSRFSRRGGDTVISRRPSSSTAAGCSSAVVPAEPLWLPLRSTTTNSRFSPRGMASSAAGFLHGGGIACCSSTCTRSLCCFRFALLLRAAVSLHEGWHRLLQATCMEAASLAAVLPARRASAN